MFNDRPLGVMLFCVLYFVYSVISIAVSPYLSIAYIVTCIMLFMMEPFARYMAMAVSGLTIIANLAGYTHLYPMITKQYLFVNRLPFMLILVLTIILHAGAFFYFTRSEVKDHFGLPH